VGADGFAAGERANRARAAFEFAPAGLCSRGCTQQSASFGQRGPRLCVRRPKPSATPLVRPSQYPNKYISPLFVRAASTPVDSPAQQDDDGPPILRLFAELGRAIIELQLQAAERCLAAFLPLSLSVVSSERAPLVSRRERDTKRERAKN